MQNHRITKTHFRAWSTRRSLSQAPLCLYTLWLVSNQPEGTFARLRYSLGGDRPSQTAHLTMSLNVSLTPRLVIHIIKGGIPPTAQYTPEGIPLCLPPILCIIMQITMSSYSKASWGLSVQPRLTGVFTGTTISPSPSPRQCPNRYAIRAGRNLPDKEFRYLRTVIVTAAVYRGFSSELRITPNPSP